jgi:hypothetical protein
MLPRTFAFRTKEGSVGLLQIVGGDEEEVRLRYKLLGYGEGRAAAEVAGGRRAGWLAINDVVVRTVQSQGAMKECMLDLETGKLFSPTMGMDSPTFMQSWIAERGVDLIGEISLKGAAGFNMAAVLLDDSVWDGATAERVNELGLGGAANVDGTLLVGPTTVTVPSESGQGEVSGGEDFPVTYAFRTGEGTVGLLQILAAGDDEIYIRYKLLGYGKAGDLGGPGAQAAQMKKMGGERKVGEGASSQ